MKMSKRARTALEKSIQHWRENVEATDEWQIGVGASDCALCALYNRPYMIEDRCCRACPVMKRTGRQYCDCTPHDDAWAAVDNLRFRDDCPPIKADWARWRKAAQAELEFLESLLQEAGK